MMVLVVVLISADAVLMMLSADLMFLAAPVMMPGWIWAGATLENTNTHLQCFLQVYEIATSEEKPTMYIRCLLS